MHQKLDLSLSSGGKRKEKNQLSWTYQKQLNTIPTQGLRLSL